MDVKAMQRVVLMLIVISCSVPSEQNCFSDGDAVTFGSRRPSGNQVGVDFVSSCLDVWRVSGFSPDLGKRP